MGASALPVRTGIVFLRSKGAPFVEREPADAETTRARLLDAASSIAAGRRSGSWPRIEPGRCRELGCGFFRRCHGDDDGRGAALEGADGGSSQPSPTVP